MPPSYPPNSASDFGNEIHSNPYASPPVPPEPTWPELSDSPTNASLPDADDLILPGGDERLWTVVPIKRITLRDLRTMTRNPFEFAIVVLVFKILRFPSRPSWAAALLDQREIGDQEIPDVFVADFETARAEAAALGFVDPRYITSPTVGPRMSVEMLMTTPDGRVQLTFHRLITLDGVARLDETRRGFYSRLAGDRSLITSSKMPEPRPTDWQIMTRMRTKSLEKLLNRHRKNLAEHASRPIDASRMVEQSIEEDRRIIADVIERGILREANGNDIINITQRYG